MKTRMEESRVQLGRRYRQVRDQWKTQGAKGVADRLRRAMAEKISPVEEVLPVRRADVMDADLSRPPDWVIPEMTPGRPLVANWVTTPPSPGSGGHTTLFRIIRYLEQHGYRNRVYFYDVYGGDHSYYASFVRSYYDFHGPVAAVEAGMQDADLVFATGWPTAYPVFNATSTGKRFYFIQDFEPYFHPVGTLSLLAESSYRMGFHGISIGECYAQKLRDDYGMTVDTFKYGCDISRYHALPSAEQRGVVFYARRESARRGVELGLMALEVFARMRPDVPIHIYGDKMGALPFPFIDHGRVTPQELNILYNQCRAGLSLSFTNVSLVALEMLAAGCIPVVNDTPQVRTDLNNSFVRYAEPYPKALARELDAVVSDRSFAALSQDAIESVRGTSWDEAGATVDSIIRRSLGLATADMQVFATSTR